MSLPSNIKQNLMPSEISFMTENEYIQILPRYSMKSIQLIGTKIPNLRALRREKVPLWVALILKSQGKCNIVIPDWLNLIYLKARYDEEVKFPMKFSDLPFNWIDLSKILLSKAPDDLPDPVHQLRSIIQDLREIRQVKTRKGLKEVNESNIGLSGLSLLEINELRPFMLSVMNKLREIHESVRHDDYDDEEVIDVDDDED
ncbi:DNA replication protein psf2 [Yamadazyma tenuis]|uniref:DNA replication complex GINS protein PSF2 n=1 Tax=Candida tenuis (strain ATCC 10573 / BCRC 21748 / CBS 615 / JCM 9827 / NBRC 10315 / NRRL Y-1498 / VKM Y-70) TaxID=590646 RepID=G3B5L2_CANTC|nr:GINS complex, PSF2 component [Yamadazyma tenuis ATCC 10573]EGV63255.1 GINS complex, PSF2 component [Yamadazyma tenuis ATCC 10573]WEJ96928.1 DNA replication protein psf2 [Yamadazyma tenuis]